MYCSWEIESFDPVKFAKIKSYAESRGWRNVRWLNGYAIGLPPLPVKPWLCQYTEYEIYLPDGQFELCLI
jgi:hypothetical protein